MTLIGKIARNARIAKIARKLKRRGTAEAEE
jgi:hypothetical protein